MEKTVRQRLLLSGQVQGVGLRFRVQHAAEALDLTGWVENLPDGTVLVEAQGAPEQLARLLPMVERSRYICIERVERRMIEPLESEYGFSVRGW